MLNHNTTSKFGGYHVTAEVITYSAETAHMFETDRKAVYASNGGAALAPLVVEGFKLAA